MARQLKEATGPRVTVPEHIETEDLPSPKFSNILRDPSQNTTNMGILMNSKAFGSGYLRKYRSPLGHRSQDPVVVYRNVKYSGVVGRCRALLQIYAQRMVLHHLAPLMSGCHNYLLEAFGFLYLLLMTPAHICLTLVLFLLRQIRLSLVKKFYPEALVCEDFSPRCIFIGKSFGMVTCVLWMKSRVDLNRLRSYVQTKSASNNCCPVLRQNIVDKFGIRVFMTPESPFDVSNHVVEAPKKFLKFFVCDETLHGGKSALEQFVTLCASQDLDPDLPPWKITVIPQPVFRKEKTCIVLRFHYVLLHHPQVEQLLQNLFTQSIYEELGHQQQDSVKYFCSSKSTGSEYRDGSLAPFSKQVQGRAQDLKVEEDGEVQIDFELPHQNVRVFLVNMSNLCGAWFQTNMGISISDLKTWWNLQRKMIKFHSKRAFLRYVVHEILIESEKVLSSIQNIPRTTQWAHFRYTLSQILIILRAAAYVPVEIFSTLLHAYPRGGNGLKIFDKGTRKVAWSSPVPADLLQAIRIQTGASTQSIVLTACSLALKDYYVETNLPNPKYLGVLAPIVTKDLLAPTGYRCVDLQTDNVSILEQLQKIDGKLKKSSPWMLLGHYYIVKYISYILPRTVAYLVLRKMFKRYPITFTQVNMQSPSSILFPHISLWGQTVDEFLYWRPPQSDFCVSISFIKYSELTRLSVLSPIKSLDTALTQRFCQNLNRIAEGVGVEKHRIPYSRKSSPISTNCSTPAGFKKL
ncbi:unnamed protein product [Allacma fusca]|uniref:O-acyltransferase WSD1 C-terminal domain-containing protein n=1 Tax=Allacma fusca TaxID=39272 RepID=A0A8J2PJK0_9HEXA|nr:unnamed protein product [Allacma fusca]